MGEVTTITIKQEKESGLLSKITCENCVISTFDRNDCYGCIESIASEVVNNDDPQMHIFNPDTELSDEEREVKTK